MPKVLLALLALCLATAVHAADAPLTAAEPELEAKMLSISGELRCLVCQNETIAASNAELAVDLRNQIRDMLRQGQSQQQIIDYMTARYGDFVLYRPPMRVDTVLLWFGPTLLMIGGLATLFIVLRRRSRLGSEHFDPDEPEDIEPAARPADPAK
jgi:cytochrome c-type biogenesis protein CcmH